MPDDGGFSTLTADEFPFTSARLSYANTPKLTPNESTGAFQYTLPIITPPGRNGLNPKLELVYDSSFGKNEYLGLGWSTNIPYIERINRTGTDHLHTEGYFLSSLDGELREAPSIEEMAMEGGEFFLKEKRQAPEEGNFGLASAIIREKPSISERLEQKTAAERAAIKAEEIAKIGSIFRTSREHYDIQVESIGETSRGVEVFARAWDRNGQIGFGRDGSVDIERFIFANPPILVPDPNGTIVRSTFDPVTEQTFTFTYREDVQEAFLQALEHTIEVKQQKFGSGRIVPQKVGNTTTIVYPDADPESTSVDGYAAFDASTSSWSTIQSATSSASAEDTPTLSNGAYTGKDAGQYWLYRAFFLFDTSSIESDTIDSATFSLNPAASMRRHLSALSRGQ